MPRPDHPEYLTIHLKAVMDYEALPECKELDAIGWVSSFECFRREADPRPGGWRTMGTRDIGLKNRNRIWKIVP